MPLFGPPDVEKLKAQRDVRGLMKALSYSKNQEVQRQAAGALGQIGDARAVEPLVVALQDPYSAVRLQAAAAEALGQIGDVRAVEPLVVASQDWNFEVRRAAAKALGSMDDRQVANRQWKPVTDQWSSAAIPAPPREGRSMSSPVSVTIDGTSFPLVTSVAALCAAIEEGGKGVLRFPSLTYSEVLDDLTQRLEKRYGRMSRQENDLFSSPLVCAVCLWEFPGSYRLSLQGAFLFRGGGLVLGATPGFDRFGESGICPQCGSRESLLVYEYFPPEQITESDVSAIRRYWLQQART